MANRARKKWTLSILAVVLALSAALAAVAAPASAAPAWSEVTDLPRAGVFNTPLGSAGELSCVAANRCLLATDGGNSGFGPSIFSFNGSAWRQYASVCGSPVSFHGRIVWAAPNEFWLITQPSPPFGTAIYAGQSLCHVVNGAVVGSYSKLRELGAGDEAYFAVNSGACAAPDNCWFGGAYESLPGGVREGAYHLHWDGQTISSVFAPQGRAVTDIVRFDGELVESTLVGARRNDFQSPVFLTTPETEPRLLHTIDASGADAGAFENTDFAPAPIDGLPVESTEILALDTNGGPLGVADRIWAVGGGATSGPGANGLDPVERGVFVATREAGGEWVEIPVTPTSELGAATFPFALLTDVAAIPETDEAIAAMTETGAVATVGESVVVRIDALGAMTREVISPSAGTIVRVACADEHNCWAVNWAGRIFRFSDPTDPPLGIDGDPAFTTTITFRPNEVAAQAVGDSPPVDDSLLFAPPPPPDDTPAEQPKAKRLPAAVKRVRSKLRGTKLVIEFTVVRKARVTVTAKRKRRVVARARSRLLPRGRHRLTLRLNPSRWPTKLAMKVVEPGQEPKDDNAVTVPDGGIPTDAVTAVRCHRASCDRRGR